MIGRGPDAPRYLLHVDLDQFLAAVEVLKHPDLAGRPIVVGGTGDPRRRGVVSTASYEARRYGVRSGMPLRTALRRCPEAIFLPLDLPAYQAASESVMAVLRECSPEVEVLGWDEAYLVAATDRPELVARRIQDRVLRRTGLTCSVGIGENRLQAKIASGLAKPAGVFRLDGANWWSVMGSRSPDDLTGIGAKRARALAGLGIRTVAQLAGADQVALSRAFGPSVGPWLIQLARGVSSAAVMTSPRIPASRGHQVTYQEDLVDPAGMRREVARLARELAHELEGADMPADRIEVTVRFTPFETHSRSRSLDGSGSGEDAIERAALAALSTFTLKRPVRLLGVRARLPRPRSPRRWALRTGSPEGAR